MTKQQRYAETINRLTAIGLSFDDACALFKIERTLQRWAERECGVDNGCIERDETTGKPYWLNSTTMRRFPIRDTEKAALKRMQEISSRYTGIAFYHQTDPRGCAVYCGPVDWLGGSPINQGYSRLIACCI